MIKDFLKYHRFSLLLILSCFAFYFVFAYDLERTDHTRLFMLYWGLFFLSYKSFQLEKFNLSLLFGAGILFRMIFLFSLPELSQDYFRFIWDGRILLEGINPYIYSPTELVSSGTQVAGTELLLEGMGSLSAGNNSNYPPLSQLVFLIAAIISGKNIIGAVICMRVIIIAADIGIFYFGRKILSRIGLQENKIFWYFLNPFIIIELTGNLHLEGVMIFFLLAGFYLLLRGKHILSAVLFACSVGVKLIPLIFLPLLFKKLGPKKFLLYVSVTGLSLILLFTPFLSDELLADYFATTALWFEKFEFNAGVYYLVRYLGYEFTGYNIIALAGSILAVMVLLIVLLLSLLRKNKENRTLLTSMVFAISAYYFLATTVHPWYLALPLILSIFTSYKFVQLWAFLVILSYAAYDHSGFEENHFLIAIEYILVLGFLAGELIQVKMGKRKTLQ